MNILFLLGLGTTGVVTFLTYLLIQLPKTYRLKYLAVPLFILLGTLFAMELPKTIGTPVQGYPTKEFKLVGFKIIRADTAPRIQAWVVEDGQSRLYEFPFSSQVIEALRLMIEEGRNGKFRGGRGFGNLVGSGNDINELSTIEIPFDKLPAKE